MSHIFVIMFRFKQSFIISNILALCTAENDQSLIEILSLCYGNAVKPRFWNTFAAKILFINGFFAADQNF